MKAVKHPKIVFVHLLNDYSGSPLVLANVIKGLQQRGIACELITCSNSDGFLSEIESVKYHYFKYHWHSNKLVRLILFLWSQAVLFFKILEFKNENVSIYINTILPFGAAIAGKLLNKKVTYHLHEVSIRPLLLKKYLKWIFPEWIFPALLISLRVNGIRHLFLRVIRAPVGVFAQLRFLNLKLIVFMEKR